MTKLETATQRQTQLNALRRSAEDRTPLGQMVDGLNKVDASEADVGARQIVRDVTAGAQVVKTPVDLEKRRNTRLQMAREGDQLRAALETTYDQNSDGRFSTAEINKGAQARLGVQVTPDAALAQFSNDVSRTIPRPIEQSDVLRRVEDPKTRNQLLAMRDPKFSEFMKAFDRSSVFGLGKPDGKIDAFEIATRPLEAFRRLRELDWDTRPVVSNKVMTPTARKLQDAAIGAVLWMSGYGKW